MIQCPVCNGEMEHWGKHAAWNTVRNTKTKTFTCGGCGLRMVFKKNNYKHRRFIEANYDGERKVNIGGN